MTSLKFLFRADRSNVGDWWCPPFRYFPFKEATIGDIIDTNFPLDNTDILVLGGGGIGSNFFKDHLDRIKNAQAKTTIRWGAGVDVTSDKKGLLTPENQDLYGNYFDFIDEVGIRVFSEPQKFSYVPCASCMSNLFFKYREVKPTNTVGVYNHKRVKIMDETNPHKLPVFDNSGNNLEDKLKFLSSCEYVVTNTYHGVYWATLLERRAVVLPFKSGLFSFKHPPSFCLDGDISDDVLNNANCYKNVLEEARKINLDFYKYLTDKYDLV